MKISVKILLCMSMLLVLSSLVSAYSPRAECSQEPSDYLYFNATMPTAVGIYNYPACGNCTLEIFTEPLPLTLQYLHPSSYWAVGINAGLSSTHYSVYPGFGSWVATSVPRNKRAYYSAFLDTTGNPDLLQNLNSSDYVDSYTATGTSGVPSTMSQIQVQSNPSPGWGLFVYKGQDCPSGTIPNSAPQINQSFINPTDTVINTTELECGFNVTDSDGDIVNVTTKWYKNTSGTVTFLPAFNGTFTDIILNSSTYTNSSNGNITTNLLQGSSYFCQIDVTDGTDTATINTSSLTVNSAPSITLISPADGLHNNTASLDAIFNVTDINSDSLSCGLYVDSILQVTNSSVTNSYITTLSTGLANESINWYINCTDGNYQTISETRAFKEDSLTPFNTILNPLVNVTTFDPLFWFNATVEDTYLDKINFTLYNYSNNKPVNYTYIDNILTDSYNFSTQINFSKIGQGKYYGEVCSVDSLQDSPKIKDKTILRSKEEEYNHYTYFYDQETGTNVSRRIYITKSGTSQKLTHYNLNVTDYWDEQGKHIKSDFGMIKKNKNFELHQEFTCIAGCTDILYKNDRDRERLITDNNVFYWHQDDAVLEGWQVDYFSNDITIKSPNVDFYNALDNSFVIDPTTGGLNTVCTNTSVVFFDSLKPVITIISPVNNTKYNNKTLLINFSATDSGSGLNKIFYGNTSLNTTYTEPIYYIFSEGNQNFYFYANDTAGNLATTIINVSIDTISPAIYFSNDSSSGNQNIDWLYVNYSVSDIHLDTVLINLYNSSYDQINSSINSGINFTSLSDGTYFINITANDTYTNINQTETREIVIDQTAPVITITNPVNNTKYTTKNLLVNFTATDSGVGVDTQFFDNGTVNTTYTVPLFFHFPEGNTQVTFYANDSVGNLASSTINVSVDSIAPSINFTANTSSTGGQNNDWIYTDVIVSDTNLDSYVIYLYNSSYTEINSSINIGINFTSLSDGSYYINASANDTYGNINWTETRQIDIDNTDPTVNNVTVIPSNTNAVISINASESVNVTVYYSNNLSNINLSTFSSNFANPKSIGVTGLTAETTYYFNFTICDNAGNCADNSTVRNFTTTATPVTPPAGGGGGGVASCSEETEFCVLDSDCCDGLSCNINQECQLDLVNLTFGSIHTSVFNENLTFRESLKEIAFNVESELQPSLFNEYYVKTLIFSATQLEVLDNFINENFGANYLIFYLTFAGITYAIVILVKNINKNRKKKPVKRIFQNI